MVYSSFTLDSAVKAFHLELVESADLSSQIEPIVPRPHFITDLAKKAKSELIVAIQQCDKILGILTSMVAQNA